MKIRRLFFQILLFAIFMTSFLEKTNAQSEEYPSAFSINLLEMDYHSLRKGENFNFDNLSFGLKLGYHRYLFNEIFHLEIPLNLGFAKIADDDPATNPNTLENKFKASLGGLFQVDFLKGNEKLRPYFSTGVVGSYLKKDNPWHAEIPIGVGMDFKVSSKAYLQIRPEFRVGLFSKNTNNFNLNFGVRFILDRGNSAPPPISDDDIDDDGVANKDDNCPTTPGPVANMGCPYGDADGDGVMDDVDLCKDTPGLVELSGCPEVKKEDQEAVSFAAKNIQFETNSAKITTSSYAELNKIVAILKLNPATKVFISGHTDSVGNEAANQKLSELRAEACLNYLVDQGIDVRRLSAVGFGETQPKANNSTEEGKRINRRVEFQLAN